MPEALPMAQGAVLVAMREVTDTHCGYADILLMSPFVRPKQA